MQLRGDQCFAAESSASVLTHLRGDAIVTSQARFATATVAFSIILLSSQNPAAATAYKGIAATQFVRNDNNSFKHFTIYDSEIQQITAGGKWTPVAADFYAFDRPLPGLVPLYRVQKNGDHFFTIFRAERDKAITVYGYKNEQICCYISPGWIPGTAPLMRFEKGGIHSYQPFMLVGAIAPSYSGATQEGFAGYVWPTRDFSGKSVPAPVLIAP